jgi:hypothetical protein
MPLRAARPRNGGHRMFGAMAWDRAVAGRALEDGKFAKGTRASSGCPPLARAVPGGLSLTSCNLPPDGDPNGN